MQPHDTTRPNPDKTPYGFCHCGCGQKTTLAKRNLPKRGIAKGQPMPFCNGHHVDTRPSRPLEDRFWEKVDRQGRDECWVWTAKRDKRGYGRLSQGKKAKMGKYETLAHRISYSMNYGPIPDGLLVCHSCDNPSCVNPSHLFLGTDQDNVDDMIAKGRNKSIVGAANPSAKLNRLKVRSIRAMAEQGIPQNEIAKRFNVSKSLISQIMSGALWKHT